MALDVAPYIEQDGEKRLLGNVLGNPGVAQLVRFSDTKICWEPNIPFQATLQLVDIPGLFVLEDVTTGVKYPVFPTEVKTLILEDAFRGGVVSGLWVVEKKNTSYGVARFRS